MLWETGGICSCREEKAASFQAFHGHLGVRVMLSSLLLMTQCSLQVVMGCAANSLQGMKKRLRAEYGSAYTIEASSEAVVAELHFQGLNLLLSCFFSTSVLIFWSMLKPYSSL